MKAECTFDSSGFCGFSNADDAEDDVTDDFDWSLGYGSLRAATGPAMDQDAAENGAQAGDDVVFPS